MKNYREKEKKHVSKRVERYFFLGVVIGGFVGLIGFMIFDNVLFILSTFILSLLGVLLAMYLDKKEFIEKNKKIFSNK